MIDPSPDEALLRGFIRPDRLPRYLALLGKRGGRDQIRARLAHLGDLDSRFAVPVPGGDSSVARIGEALRKKGAPRDCYCLSQNPALDGQVIPLEKALGAVIGMGYGTFLSCVPGKVGYFEGEGPSWRFILDRAAV